MDHTKLAQFPPLHHTIPMKFFPNKTFKANRMKRSLLARLRTNGALYLISAVLLGLGVPLYWALALVPAGFNSAVSGQAQGTYLVWIHGHNGLFLGYRIMLLLAFALIWTLPFSLYRIIVAQEILGQQEGLPINTNEADAEDDLPIDIAEVDAEDDLPIDIADDDAEEDTQNAEETAPAPATASGMPAFAWRGKGFVVLAAWLGTAGLLLYVVGTIVSTLYLIIASAPVTSGKEVADRVILLSGTFTIITNTIGIGLLGLGILFFGAMITRTGMNLWPGIWVALGYAAILVGALLCIGAIAAGTDAGGSQSLLNTAGTFLFALWTFWLGLMLIRLQPE
jgi:hypothetical protein